MPKVCATEQRVSMFGIAPTSPGARRKLHVHSAIPPTKGSAMLYTIAVILIILWLLGLVSSYTMGGFIHILLVVALIVILVNFLSGRRGI